MTCSENVTRESRFYDVDEGRILCNGIDVTKINVYAYRRHLSLVAQEATLFQGMPFFIPLPQLHPASVKLNSPGQPPLPPVPQEPFVKTYFLASTTQPLARRSSTKPAGTPPSTTS